MRLSDAINLGSLLLKPVAGTRGDGNDGGCALGMAGKAAGGYVGCGFADWAKEIQSVDLLPCECGKDGSKIMGSSCDYFYRASVPRNCVHAITHLFNYHVCTAKDWTLEQLVDWVRSVEPDEPEIAATEPESLPELTLAEELATIT